MLMTVIVVISGFIGRYIYTRVPRNADGLMLDAGELQAQDEAVDLLRSSTSSSKRGLVAAYARKTGHGGNGGTEFIREFGDEHAILTEVPVAELARVAPENVAEAVDRMRKGQVVIKPGHDGEYGEIHLFGDGPQADASASQLSLF